MLYFKNACSYNEYTTKGGSTLSLLKDIYTTEFLTNFSNQILPFQPNFKTNHFIDDILKNDWAELTVRQRMKKIATTLGLYLDGTYEEQLPIILELHKKNTGFNFLFLPDFISIYGLSDTHFSLSLEYLKLLTPYSSSEFPIREFILYDEEKVLPLLIEWSLDDNEHVRRLASEGSRPRLPWSFQLTNFKDNPELCLPILTNLRANSSLYVRKSVANHLNDISKDHPDFVVDLCRSWIHQTTETDWIIKKACRSLIKQAYPDALTLFGYTEPGTTFNLIDSSIETNSPMVAMGDSLSFDYDIKTNISVETPIRIEYGIDYMKANGQHSLKKFYVTDGFFTKKTFSGKKKISFKDLSTRKHYIGEHKLYLYLNGQKIASTSFELHD